MQMKARTLTALQLWHLALLAMLPLLFAVFRMVSEPYDPTRALVDGAVAFVSVVLSTYSFIYIVVTGKSDGSVASLWRAYRDCLQRLPFLVVGNLALTALLALLLCQLAGFRQVEFLSAQDVEIYLADELGPPERLGFLRGRKPSYFRLSIGVHRIVVKETATQQWLDAQTLDLRGARLSPRTPSMWVGAKGGGHEKPR